MYKRIFQILAVLSFVFMELATDISIFKDELHYPDQEDTQQDVCERFTPRLQKAINESDITLHIKNYISEESNNFKKNNIVAILDTGFSINEPLLKDRVIGFFTPGTDTENQFREIYIHEGMYFDEKSCNWMIASHGTFVSGIVSQVYPQVKLTLIKLGPGLEDAWKAFQRMNEIRRVREPLKKDFTWNDVKIVNMSFGPSFSGWHEGLPPGRRIHWRKLIESGCTLVIALGNESTDLSNTKYGQDLAAFINELKLSGLNKRIIFVGATDYNIYQGHRIAKYNNKPFEGIESNTIFTIGKITSSVPGREVSEKSGTSAAAPVISGFLAFLMNEFGLSNEEAFDAVIQSRDQQLILNGESATTEAFYIYCKKDSRIKRQSFLTAVEKGDLLQVEKLISLFKNLQNTLEYCRKEFSDEKTNEMLWLDSNTLLTGLSISESNGYTEISKLILSMKEFSDNEISGKKVEYQKEIISSLEDLKKAIPLLENSKQLAPLSSDISKILQSQNNLSATNMRKMITLKNNAWNIFLNAQVSLRESVEKLFSDVEFFIGQNKFYEIDFFIKENTKCSNIKSCISNFKILQETYEQLKKIDLANRFYQHEKILYEISKIKKLLLKSNSFVTYICVRTSELNLIKNHLLLMKKNNQPIDVNQIKSWTSYSSEVIDDINKKPVPGTEILLREQSNDF